MTKSMSLDRSIARLLARSVAEVLPTHCYHFDGSGNVGQLTDANQIRIQLKIRLHIIQGFVAALRERSICRSVG